MKRILTFLTAGALALGLCGCGLFGTEPIEDDIIPLEPCSELVVSFTQADIILKLGDTDQVHYHTFESQVPVVTKDGDKLGLDQKEYNTAYRSFSDERTYVEITLTQNTLSHVELITTSGDISTEGMDLNGAISATSGDVSVTGSSGGGALTVDTTSGDTAIYSSSFDSLQCTSTSGDLYFDGATLGTFTSTATSGDVSVQNTDLESAGIETTSGNITLSLKGSENDYDFDLSAASGELRLGNRTAEGELKADNGSGRTISAKATSGDISISFTP